MRDQARVKRTVARPRRGCRGRRRRSPGLARVEQRASATGRRGGAPRPPHGQRRRRRPAPDRACGTARTPPAHPRAGPAVRLPRNQGRRGVPHDVGGRDAGDGAEDEPGGGVGEDVGATQLARTYDDAWLPFAVVQPGRAQVELVVAETLGLHPPHRRARRRPAAAGPRGGVQGHGLDRDR